MYNSVVFGQGDQENGAIIIEASQVKQMMSSGLAVKFGVVAEQPIGNVVEASVMQVICHR